jgi:mRNA-degrading endonuclease RelE of RelBE toxin-antitoxin system
MMDTEGSGRPWQVNFARKAEKQADSLPMTINDALFLLKDELEQEGPVQFEWHHYGKFGGKKREYHHCHLNKGHPRYVAVWVVENFEKQILEICFAGTHEKVNYKQFR